MYKTFDCAIYFIVPTEINLGGFLSAFNKATDGLMIAYFVATTENLSGIFRDDRCVVFDMVYSRTHLWTTYDKEIPYIRSRIRSECPPDRYFRFYNPGEMLATDVEAWGKKFAATWMSQGSGIKQTHL